MVINMNKYYQWFDNFVEQHLNTPNRDQSNYELKIEHTYRVKENILELGKLAGLSDEKQQLCELTGLFHDLGRFKQYTEYNSFSDSISGSHGDLSVQILDVYNVLSELEPMSADRIYQAITYHNYFLVPETIDEETKQLCHLLRDADKLDAFFLETKKDEHRSYNFEALSEEKAYSDLVIQDLMNGRQVDFKNIQYQYDRKLGILGLIFNLKYKESFELIEENKYIERLFEDLPKDFTMKQLEQFVTEYVTSKINLST